MTLPQPSVHSAGRHALSRRQLLNGATGGFFSLALAGLLGGTSRGVAGAGIAPGLGVSAPHRRPRAKSVIFLYMEGGPSQLDTFDYKPALEAYDGQQLPMETPATVFDIGKRVLKSPYVFQRHGESGAWVSEIFPHVAGCVDDLTIVHSMHHDFSNHTSACFISHTGHALPGRPSLGSWAVYGLGSECDSLPGFVVLDCGMGPSAGAQTWGSGFLPAAYQGTLFGKSDEPVDCVRPIDPSPQEQRRKLNALATLNRGAAAARRDSRLDAMIDNYELAYRMQSSVPELTDFADESPATRQLYGLDDDRTKLFGSRCLMARRLVERGVRFIEVFPPNLDIDRWDQHKHLAKRHRMNAEATDQPVAALLKDLKQRGLLDDTIVIWGGEFGRTPNAQGKNGRDHNPFGYTMWIAGGGFKPGIRYGATDEFGYFAVENKVHLHDLHATVLHQLGIDHERLTYRHQGRDFRLTDVHGRVVRDILA